jgi:hypothetical protein
MTTIESVKLSEVLRLVSKPRFVLGTTYTLSLAFFESVVFPFIDRSRLKSCLILCDPLGYHNALAEAAALQSAGQDYMVVPVPTKGSFHPKVWVIVGEGEAALIVGSGNLTQAGFMTNAELFDVVHMTAKDPPPASLISSVRSFTRGLAGRWPEEDRQHLLCVETLRQIEQALAELPTAQPLNGTAPLLLHSFQGPLIQQLPAIPDARDLYVAAPYFGNSLQGLRLLTARYPNAKLHLFPAVHDGAVTNIPLPDIRKAYAGAHIAQLAVPSKKNAFNHLKLYAVTGPGDAAWLCCTSANCTEAAWQEPNIEAALLRPIAPSVAASYFAPAAAPLPANSADIKIRNENIPELHCWATDTGAGIDIVVASDSRKQIPLRNVTLTARAGSALATCQKPALFQEGPLAHIHWTAFAGWQRHRKVAISLEIAATSANGKPTRGTCLVENDLLLTAEPAHRSAWRGALALLDAEGAPELADIGAIFTLANDVFDGNLFRPHDTDVVSESPKPTPQKPDGPPGIAVWPPQPDTKELRKRIGSTALGQLQWFQHILKTLLNAGAATETDHQPQVGTPTPQDQGEEDYKDQTRPEHIQKAAPKAAERLWQLAHEDYDNLRDKLMVLCPTPQNAPNIWPAAILAFLSALAVMRAARRLAPDLALGSTPELLCDDFLRSFFNPRRQDDDFCCPKGHRYYRFDPSGEKFPPLAEDLRYGYKISLDPNLAEVMLALITDKTMRNPDNTSNPVWQRKQQAMLFDPSFKPNADNREASRRVWRNYLCDPLRKETDADFEHTFDKLLPSPKAPPTL